MGAQTLKRYDRQLLLPEIGIAGQQKLKEASVLVIGAGGLGCPILLYLAGAGIGKIGIIDHDIVDLSNLHRQILYHMTDIGHKKAEVAAEKLRLLNPEVNITAYDAPLSTENAVELISQYDVVIDGSDNFPTRYLVNDTAVALNKVLIFGSIYQFEGQVSVFNYNGGPDYRSIYPEAPLPEDAQNCGDAGVLGTLPGIIGSIMANEAIKVICDFGEVLSGQLLIFNTLGNDVTIFKFGKPAVSKRIEDQGTLSVIIPELTPAKLKEWEDQQISYQLIDVREIYEFEEFNIGGINIPLYELNERLDQLSAHERIVFCCSIGKRSKIAIQLVKPLIKAELFSLILK